MVVLKETMSQPMGEKVQLCDYRKIMKNNFACFSYGLALHCSLSASAWIIKSCVLSFNNMT